MKPQPLLLSPHKIPILLAALATGLLAGCSVQGPADAPATSPAVALSGRVHGGQQPVAGAVLQLYAAGANGYGSAATPLLPTAVTSGADGSFSITGDYTCPANALVYLTATGGNPGLGAGTQNNALALMAALGPCSALNSATIININELTTVASVWALSHFMAGPASLGTSATNAGGLSQAFASVRQVVSISQGSLPGEALPAQATLPTAEINTLADILAACINSAGGTAGDATPCGQLFTASTPPGGTAPTDTLTAAIEIARNPASSVAALFALSSTAAPFQPSLAVAPQNFFISITHQGGGINAPTALAFDAQSNLWVANANSTLTQLSASGATMTITGGGLNHPSALAVDRSGNVWAANLSGNSLSLFSSTGMPQAGSPFQGGGLNLPAGISLDAGGNVWVANSGGNSVSEFTATGTPLSPGTGFTGAGINQPVAIAINPH